MARSSSRRSKMELRQPRALASSWSHCFFALRPNSRVLALFPCLASVFHRFSSKSWSYPFLSSSLVFSSSSVPPSLYLCIHYVSSTDRPPFHDFRHLLSLFRPFRHNCRCELNEPVLLATGDPGRAPERSYIRE